MSPLTDKDLQTALELFNSLRFFEAFRWVMENGEELIQEVRINRKQLGRFKKLRKKALCHDSQCRVYCAYCGWRKTWS